MDKDEPCNVDDRVKCTVDDANGVDGLNSFYCHCDYLVDPVEEAHTVSVDCFSQSLPGVPETEILFSTDVPVALFSGARGSTVQSINTFVSTISSILFLLILPVINENCSLI